MSSKNNKDTKLDILNQTRDRSPMPRPVIYRDKTKYDRNVAKEQLREELNEVKDEI